MVNQAHSDDGDDGGGSSETKSGDNLMGRL